MGVANSEGEVGAQALGSVRTQQERILGSRQLVAWNGFGAVWGLGAVGGKLRFFSSLTISFPCCFFAFFYNSFRFFPIGEVLQLDC